jgi:hypothetical protein
LSPLRGLNAATFLIAACAGNHWAIGLTRRETARNNSRGINAFAVQIMKKTTPGFAENLSL